MSATCSTCGAPVNLAPDGDERYEAEAALPVPALSGKHAYQSGSAKFVTLCATCGKQKRDHAAALPVPALDARLMRSTMPEWFGQVPDWAIYEWSRDLRAALVSQEEPRGSLKAPEINLDGGRFHAPDGSRWRITSEKP